MRILHRGRRALAVAAAAAVLVSATLFTTSAAVAAPPPPARMAALGDSISQAAMSCSNLVTCTANSWSTGSTASVQSHVTRLRAGGATSLVAYNDSVSGAASAAPVRLRLGA